jgi:DNA replication protein DnaC
METFPFDRQPKLNKKKVLIPYDTLDYMHEKRNVIFVGPTGTGKTGLATAFLI